MRLRPRRQLLLLSRALAMKACSCPSFSYHARCRLRPLRCVARSRPSFRVECARREAEVAMSSELHALDVSAERQQPAEVRSPMTRRQDLQQALPLPLHEQQQ